MRTTNRIPWLASVAALLAFAASASSGRAQGIELVDMTRAAGIDFTHNNGARGEKYLPETMGSGVAFFDYNNDGWPDIFFVNSVNWPARGGAATSSALYRNNQDGTFSDVTRAAGLRTDYYGMGAAVADYDNDGDEDLFVTALGPNHLYENDGDGTFTERTPDAGLAGSEEFSTSAAWSDYDNDGDVDLFVVNYVQWSVEDDLFCTLDGSNKSYCTPESYEGASMRLWQNDGNGRFTEATEGAGVFDPTSKGLGIGIFDENQDGWPDVMVINDTEPNKLYRNNRDGTFTERGLLSGVAFSESGVARAGMGVDAADYDRSGYPSVAIGNFSNQMLALYHNEGNGLFIDDAPRSPVGRNSLLTLTFATLFFDYDLDGWLDLLAVNGHIEEGFERIQSQTKFAQPPHLFRNLQREGFEEVTARMGEAFAMPRVARAAATADIDRDGDLDILVTTNGGRPVLFRNEAATGNGLRVKLEGSETNRDGLGAKVTVTSGTESQSQTLESGAGYLSSSELVLTFGLGSAQEAGVEVVWPSGTVDTIEEIRAGQTVTIREGRGVIASTQFR